MRVVDNLRRWRWLWRHYPEWVLLALVLLAWVYALATDFGRKG